MSEVDGGAVQIGVDLRTQAAAGGVVDDQERDRHAYDDHGRDPRHQAGAHAVERERPSPHASPASSRKPTARIVVIGAARSPMLSLRRR